MNAKLMSIPIPEDWTYVRKLSDKLICIEVVNPITYRDGLQFISEFCRALETFAMPMTAGHANRLKTLTFDQFSKRFAQNICMDENIVYDYNEETNRLLVVMPIDMIQGYKNTMKLLALEDIL